MIFTFLSRQLNSVQCCQGCAVSALFFEYVSDVCCALSSGLARWRLGEFCNLNIDPSPPNHHDLDPVTSGFRNLTWKQHHSVHCANAVRRWNVIVFASSTPGGAVWLLPHLQAGELKQFDLIKQSSAFNMCLQKR